MAKIRKVNDPEMFSHFKFSDIPGEMGDQIFRLALDLCGGTLDYTAFRYRVGSFSTEYDRALKSEKSNYSFKEVELDREIVKWFNQFGIKSGDVVYIEQ